MANNSTCPYCSMSIPSGATSCPNCGGAVMASSGGGVQPLGSGFGPSGPAGSSPSFGSPPTSSPGFGSPPTSSPGFGSPPSSSPGFGSPPAQGFSPPQFPAPVNAAYGKSSGGAGLIIAIVAVVVVLAIGGVVAGIAYSVSGGGSSEGGWSNPIPIMLNQPVAGSLYGRNSNQIYNLTLASPTMVTISVDGDFDNYLELYRAGESSPFQENDDGGEGLNARISTMLQAGTYQILVRPWSSGSGTFTITVQGTPMAPPPTAPPVPVPGVVPMPTPMPPGIPGGAPGALLRNFPPQSYQGLVSSVSGGAPVAAGTTCSVTITAPARSAFNCRVNVTCGGRIIYGGGNAGYNRCTVTQAGATYHFEAHDRGPTSRDTDPMLDLLTGSRQLTVSDGGEGAPMWLVTMQLTPAGGTGPATSI